MKLLLDTHTFIWWDRFDRLLIAQAQIEEAVLISKDPFFSKYPVKVVW